MTLTLLYGGTFDPVHLGHLHIARELLQQFQDAEVRLIPCQTPAHRSVPGAPSEDRLHMLHLAVDGEQGLLVDDCELKREGTSYSIDTLRHYRQVLGDDAPIAFVMGSDSWNSLPGWKDWKQMFSLAHVIVVTRPDHAPALDGVLGELVNGRLTRAQDDLARQPAGRVLFAEIEEVNVSATEIRDALNRGMSTDNLLQPAVAEYIKSSRLYTSQSATDQENKWKVKN